MQFVCIYRSKRGNETRTVTAFSPEELLQGLNRKKPSGSTPLEIRHQGRAIWHQEGSWRGKHYEKIFQELHFTANYSSRGSGAPEKRVIRANNKNALLKRAQAACPSGHKLAFIDYGRNEVWQGRWKDTSMFRG